MALGTPSRRRRWKPRRRWCRNVQPIWPDPACTGFEGGRMPVDVKAVEANQLAGRPLRYFDFVMAAFVVILLLSNVIGAGKRAVIDLPFIGPWPFGAGILFFPISYVI